VKCLAHCDTHHHFNQRDKRIIIVPEVGHDGSIITCDFFNPRGNVPNGYIAVGWLLFLQEQIKVIISSSESSPASSRCVRQMHVRRARMQNVVCCNRARAPRGGPRAAGASKSEQFMVRRPPGRSDPAHLRVVTEALREGRLVELRDRGLRRHRKK
jgi:hypothetical protein